MRPGARVALLLAWLTAIALLATFVSRTLVVGADLRLFMPTPKTPAQRLLVEQIGEGPASRLMLVALEGAPAEQLADSSQALVEALRADDAFRFASNGNEGLEQVPEALLAYRYLLSPTLDDQRLDANYLRAQLEERVQDLSSPAASMLEELLPRDPTLETLALATQWRPPHEPERQLDVWFSRDGTRALLLAETVAAGFDPDGQGAAMQRLALAVEQTRSDPAVRHVASGPGTFAVLMKSRTEGEAQTLGGIAAVGMFVLMLLAYRSVPLALLGVLPLASAAIAGMAAVSAVFGTVHGITLAFGFTLIGVAQDYPLHLFSHQHPGIAPRDNARAIWPTLATGVASTCIAYLAFLVSGVVGLAQLACFTIAGLAVAGLSTRFLLPALMSREQRDRAASPLLARAVAALARLPRPSWLALGLALASVAALVFVPGPLWENNLATLTPVPPALLERDLALRAELGAPDVRFLLVVEGENADAVLAREERLLPALEGLVAAGTVGGYDAAARYLPPHATQLKRRDALPVRSELEPALGTALAGLPFKPGVFEPFLADVERARTLEPLGPAQLEGTPLALRIGGLLLERGGRWSGIVSFTGVADEGALARFATAHGEGVTLLDLKQASESLVASYRERIIASLGVAALLLAAVVWLALRDRRRVARVLLPMALTTLLLLALLHGAGVSLSLFHLVALVLAAGLGLDYALFFEHAGEDPADQRRTLHAVLACTASTLMVFALLATSSMPVLRAIGVTVSLGVVSNFVLALLFARGGGRAHGRA